MTILLIPFSYSITTGIGVGFIAWVICKTAARKFQELRLPTVILAVVFALYFCLM